MLSLTRRSQRLVVFGALARRLSLARAAWVVSPADGQSFRDAAALTIRLDAWRANVCVIVALEGREAEATEACVDGDEIDLMSIPLGRHFVVLRAAQEASQMLNLRFSRRAVGEFAPAYAEWRPIPDGVAIEPGLEIRLPLDGSHARVARIPATWRLQQYVEPPGGRAGFWRADVRAAMTVAKLEALLGEWLAERGCAACVGHLSYGKECVPFHANATAEAIDLFSHQEHLFVAWQPATAAKEPARP
ncbi:hypothetical protein M885DRAFT_544356 [Pelagophyceae sp. CCMP2097]|nr:hypothetical protein M885DRAFT_544356 [Pelagophyceae sp. CCMP2097]